MPNEIHITTENKCKISPFPVFYYDNGCVSLEQYHTCKDRHNWHCEFLFKLVFWCARTWESSLFVNFIQTEWRCNNTLGTDRFALISARHPGALTAPRLLLELIKVKFLLHYSVVYLSNKNWKWRSYLKKKKSQRTRRALYDQSLLALMRGGSRVQSLIIIFICCLTFLWRRDSPGCSAGVSNCRSL